MMIDTNEQNEDKTEHEIELEMMFELVGASMQTFSVGDQIISVDGDAVSKELNTASICNSKLKESLDNADGNEINIASKFGLKIHVNAEVCSIFT